MIIAYKFSDISMAGHKLTLVRGGESTTATNGLDAALDREDCAVYDAVWNAMSLHKTQKGRRTMIPVEITVYTLLTS